MIARSGIVTAVLGILAFSSVASAQPLGSFKWQLQPYCNVLTFNVIGEGGNFTIDGTDDLCGALEKASATGLAFWNGNGTIGFGVTIVTPPEGRPVHVSATINLVTLSGTWSDSAGNSGTFVFTPGAGAPGSPRPATLGGPVKISVPYNLAVGATSGLISIPPNTPVSLVGTQTNSGFRGVGHVSLLSVPGAGGFIEWVGLHSTAGSTITQGFSGTAGALILYLDFAHCVNVEVGGVGGSSQIRVRNTCGSPAAGSLTITY